MGGNVKFPLLRLIQFRSVSKSNIFWNKYTNLGLNTIYERVFSLYALQLFNIILCLLKKMYLMKWFESYPNQNVILCLSFCISLCMSFWISVYLCFCISLCILLWISLCLSLCISLCLSVSLSVYLSVSLSVSLTNFLSLSVCLAVTLSLSFPLSLSPFPP